MQTPIEFLKEVSPNDEFGIRAELNKIRITCHIEEYLKRFAELSSLLFSEWISNNQFTRYNDEWTSTKIHYSGCIYNTKELYKLFLEHTVA